MANGAKRRDIEISVNSKVELTTMVLSKMILNMAKVLKDGRTETNTKDNTSMVKELVKASTHGAMKTPATATS